MIKMPIVILNLIILLSITTLVMVDSHSKDIYYSDYIFQGGKIKKIDDYRKAEASVEYTRDKSPAFNKISDPEYNNQLNLKQINMEEAWEISSNNYSVKKRLLIQDLIIIMI